MRTTFSPDSPAATHGPSLWQAAYRVLEQTILPNQLTLWIQPLSIKSVDPTPTGLRIQLVAPNDFVANWVRDRYRQQIESAVSQIAGASCEAHFSAEQSSAATTSSYQPPVERPGERDLSPEAAESHDPGTIAQRALPNGSVLTAGTTRIGTPSAPESVLDPKYTFDSYVVGASNQFAHAAAVAVAEQPGRQYNPLFIYSTPGLGKTHLLHAIGNHFLRKNPGARVAYVSAERFMNELIESLQHNAMPQFRAKYRDSYDMILIDDIQFIAGKVKTEEEFFHTFNALHARKRQLVLTSDRPPKEIAGLEERVRTRFEWGLISDIQSPEIETRIAILKMKAERDDIYLPDDVATFLATHIKSNVRELEGVLIRLQAQASLTGAEISLEMAKQELKTSIPDGGGSHFTVESIQNAVAKHYRLRIQDLKSNTRARQVALPRQIAMFLIRKYTGIGFKEIGLYFGGKDHSTIIHACNKIEKSVETDQEIQSAVESIQNLL